MKRCPMCNATYADGANRCAKDGAPLVTVAVTSGWDAVPEPAPVAKPGAITTGWDVVPEPAPAPVAKPGAITSGWDVPDEPIEAMPAVKPATPMKSSPVARKTMLGAGVMPVDPWTEPEPEPASQPEVAEPEIAPASTVLGFAPPPAPAREPALAPVPAPEPAPATTSAADSAAITAPRAPRAPESSASLSIDTPPPRSAGIWIVLAVVVLVGGIVAAVLLFG